MHLLEERLIAHDSKGMIFIRTLSDRISLFF
jgi:hypothetical protein